MNDLKNKSDTGKVKLAAKFDRKIIKGLSAVLVVLIVLTLAFSVMSCKDDPAPIEPEETTAEMIERVKHGVVEVAGRLYGSGFIVFAESEALGAEKDSCVVVTNYHVIEGSQTVSVRFFEEDAFVSATLKGFNEDFDIAVLVLEHLPEKYHVFDFEDSVSLGEEVVSLGYASRRLSAYDGIVSITDAWIKYGTKDYYVFETTAVAPYGTSGGVCLSKNGKVIGLNCYNYLSGDTLAAMSYKVHAGVLNAIYKRIMDSFSAVANPALWMVFNSDSVTITAFYQKGTFEIFAAADGSAKIQNSKNSDFPNGRVVGRANGKEVGFSGLLAQIILTGESTEIALS